MKKQRMLSLILCLALLLGISVPALAAGETTEAVFTDVGEDDWYYDAVTSVNAMGLMYGGGDGTFDPDGTTDRAMAATVLYRLEGSPAMSGEAPFDDVPADAWYAAPAAWCAAAGITDGASGSFGPVDAVSAEELAGMLLRYAGTQNCVLPDGLEAYLLDGFTDGDAGTCSRAQTASMLQRLVETLSEILPVGSPWYNTMLTWRLPASAPDGKDDLYTHYNYDLLLAHQGEEFDYMSSTSDELRAATMVALADGTQTGHALEQMRIFYDQAGDLETLAKTGFAEVQPYMDRIDAVGSLDQFNALLTAADFPFDPFLLSTLAVLDTREETIVALSPNCILSNVLLGGGTYYHETDDPVLAQARDQYLTIQSVLTLTDLSLLGMDEEEINETRSKVIAFEKAYGKYSESTSDYLKAEYGAYGQAIRDSAMTLDQVCALAPNMPIREMLAHCGKDSAKLYSVICSEWLSALNGLWVEDNLDTLKTVAKCKLLQETRPFRDPSVHNAFMASLEQPVMDADTMAYNACDNLDTFAQVIAENYVDSVLGQAAKDRLTALAAGLVDAYKELVAETDWLDDASKALVTEKLDHMTLNILEPAGGYFDYSGLELTPSEEGGTLFSNYLKLKRYRQDCENARIGQPSACDEVWFMVSPTLANAFYEPGTNSINIIPGFVTSAFYTEGMDDTALLGGLGYVVGHEISHGFDYTGSQTDAYGQPNAVFSQQSLKTFLEKCDALAERFSTVEYLPGRYVDGQNIIGEGMADLSGFQACLTLAAKNTDTDYQALFRTVALNWVTVMSQPMLELVYVPDTHPLPYLRINVIAQMFEELYDKLGVSEGDGMYLAPEKRVVVWGEQS